MSEKARHINNFLRRNRAAAGLLEGVDRDARLLEAVRCALAPVLQPHCLHAALEGGRLSLVTDGPVWASRLRFATPELLAGLRGQGLVADEARVRVAPARGPALRTAAKGAHLALSRGTIAHLREAAAEMEDPDLAAALLRLAEAGDQETARGRGA
jgi:hypothetical protein